MATDRTPIDAAVPATGDQRYDALPDSIKHAWPLDRFKWLSDAEKARLVQSECEPEDG